MVKTFKRYKCVKVPRHPPLRGNYMFGGRGGSENNGSGDDDWGRGYYFLFENCITLFLGGTT